MSFNTNALKDSVKIVSDVVYNDDKTTTHKYNNDKIITQVSTLNKCITTEPTMQWNVQLYSLDNTTFVKDKRNLYISSFVSSKDDTSVYYISSNNPEDIISNNISYSDIKIFIRNALTYIYNTPNRYTIRQKNSIFTNNKGDNVFLITDTSKNYTYTYIYITGNISKSIPDINYGYQDLPSCPYNIYPNDTSNTLWKFINVPTIFPNKPYTTYIDSSNTLSNYSDKYYNQQIKSFGISAVCVLDDFIAFVDTSKNLYTLNMPITTIFTDGTSVPKRLMPKTKLVNIDKMYMCNTFLIYETNENPKNPTINFLGYDVDKNLYNVIINDQYLLGAFPIGNNSAYITLNTFDKQFDSLAKSVFYTAEDKISFFRNTLLNNSFSELNKQNVIYNGRIRTLYDDKYVDIQNKYQLIPYKIDYNYTFTNMINITNKVARLYGYEDLNGNDLLSIASFVSGTYVNSKLVIKSAIEIYMYIENISSNIHFFVFTKYMVPPPPSFIFKLNSCTIHIDNNAIDLKNPSINIPLSAEAYSYYKNVLLNRTPPPIYGTSFDLNTLNLSSYNSTIYTFKYNSSLIMFDNMSVFDLTLFMINVNVYDMIYNEYDYNVRIQIINTIQSFPVIDLMSIKPSVNKISSFETSINYVIDLSSTSVITASGYLDLLYDKPVLTKISTKSITRLIFDTNNIVNNKLSISFKTNSKFHFISLLSINLYINGILSTFKLYPDKTVYIMSDSANMLMYTNQSYESYDLIFNIDRSNEINSYIPQVSINIDDLDSTLYVQSNNDNQILYPNITNNNVKYELSDLSYNTDYIISNVSSSFSKLNINNSTRDVSGTIYYNINGKRDDDGIYDMTTSILLNLDTRSIYNSIIIPYEFTNNLDLSNYSNYDIVNDDINEVCYLNLKNINNYVTDLTGKYITDKLTNELIYKIIKYNIYKGNTLDYITTSLYYNLTTKELYSKYNTNTNTFTYTGIDLVIKDNSNVYIKDSNNYLYRSDIILDTQTGLIDTISQYNDIIGIYNDNIRYRVDNMNDWNPKGITISKMTQKVFDIFPKIANIYDLSSSKILDKNINSEFYELITNIYPNYYITNDNKFILNDKFEVVYEQIKTNSITYYTDKLDTLNAENMLFNIIKNNNIVGHYTTYINNQNNNNIQEGLILNISDFSIYGFSELYIYTILESNLLSLRDTSSGEEYYVGILEIQRDSQSFIVTLNTEENGLPLDKYYTLTNVYDIITYGQLVTFDNNKYYLNNNNLYDINNKKISTTSTGFLTNYKFTIINDTASQITKQEYIINVVYQPDIYTIGTNQKTLYKTVDNSSSTFYMTVYDNKQLTIDFIKIENNVYHLEEINNTTDNRIIYIVNSTTLNTIYNPGYTLSQVDTSSVSIIQDSSTYTLYFNNFYELDIDNKFVTTGYILLPYITSIHTYKLTMESTDGIILYKLDNKTFTNKGFLYKLNSIVTLQMNNTDNSIKLYNGSVDSINPNIGVVLNPSTVPSNDNTYDQYIENTGWNLIKDELL